VGRICKKEGFRSGMKERVGDEKLIIISVAVRGINDIWYVSISKTSRRSIGVSSSNSLGDIDSLKQRWRHYSA